MISDSTTIKKREDKCYKEWRAYNRPKIKNETEGKGASTGTGAGAGAGTGTGAGAVDVNVNVNVDETVVPKKPFSKKKIGAGGIIIDSRHRILVVKGLTKWSLPKGHLKKGEKYYQCASREIKEETNLDIYIDPNDKYIDVKKCIYYICLLYTSRCV